MTKSKQTKQALFSSLIALILCFSMLLGTTFAWFTDSVSSGVNSIIAGNLDVELYHSTTGVPTRSDSDRVARTTQLFQMALWEPGAVVYENFLIANEGTLSLKYVLDFNLDTVKMNYVVEKDGDTPTGTGRSLADVLYVKIENGAVSGARPSYTAADGILLKDFLADTSRSITAGALEAGGSKAFSVVVYWPQGANDNQYNLKNGWYSSATANDTTDDDKNALFVELPIALNACQYTSENDSFDNQYDKLPGTLPPFVKPVSQTSAPVSSNTTTELNTDKGSVVIPENAGLPADTVAHLEVYDVETANGNLTVTDDETVVSYQVELLDQNGNKIDLSAVAEKTLLARVEVGYGLDVNRIRVYRDGTTLLTIVKYEDGYVYFESDHFCDVDVVLQEVVARIGNTYYYSYADAAENVAAGAVIDGVVDVNAMEAAIVAKFGATKFVIVKGDHQVTVKGAAAAIGTTTYESVADAVSAAQAGETIVLLDNAVSSGLTIQKDITIELNGKTLDIYAKDGFVVKYAKLTLQDTSVEQTGTINHIGAWDLADVYYEGTLAITSGTYTTNGSYGFLYLGNGQSEITGGRFNQDVTCAHGYEAVEVDGWYIPTRVYYWSDFASESYATAVDTVNKVVTIASEEELALFAKEVNNGKTYAGYTVKIASDIDLSGKRWTPISGFAGTFDGANYTIKNLEIKLPGQWSVGFFGKCASGTKIQNVTFENANVSGMHAVAVVDGGSGGSEATFSNVTVKGDIQLRGSWYVGTIFGYGYSQIDNCHVVVNEGSKLIGSGGYAGGIVGFMGEGNNKTSNCTVENLYIESCWNGIGGISGILHYGNTITNCIVKNTIVHQNETDPDEIGRAAMIAGTYLTHENSTETLTSCQFIGGRVYDDTADYTGTAWIGGPWGGSQPDVGTIVVENNVYTEVAMP